jgi:hypothetical protein
VFPAFPSNYPGGDVAALVCEARATAAVTLTTDATSALDR